MSSIAELLSQAEKCSSSNPKQAEDLYKKILHNTSGKFILYVQDQFYQVQNSFNIERTTSR
jgi:hypothetical protein